MNIAWTNHDRDWYMICDDPKNIVANSRHDDTCFSESGFNSDKPYPGTMPHNFAPKGGDNGRRLNKHLWDYIYELNRRFGTLIGWEKGCKIWGGYINGARNVGKSWSPPEWKGGYTIPLDTTVFPKVEGITAIHNYVNVLERRNGAAKIETFRYNQTMPSLDVVNPLTQPWMFCKFTSVAKDTGAVGLAPEGELFYFPLLAPDEAWIFDEQLTFDVELPQEKKNMAANLDFLDMSWHNEKVDHLGLRDDGVRGGIAKVWDGYFMSPGYSAADQHFDAQFKNNWNGLAEYELRGAYLFGRFDTASWRPATLAAQVSQAIAYVGSRKAEDVFVLDIEQPASQIAHITKASRMAMLVDALQEAETQWPKKFIWIYTGAWWWDPQMPSIIDPYILEFPVWCANYPGTLNADNNLPDPLFGTYKPKVPNGWTADQVIAWQYSDKGKIDGKTFDVNDFRWNWDAYFDTINPTPPPPPTPPEDDLQLVLDEMQTVIDRHR